MCVRQDAMKFKFQSELCQTSNVFLADLKSIKIKFITAFQQSDVGCLEVNKAMQLCQTM